MKFSNTTFEALEKSITHWEENLDRAYAGYYNKIPLFDCKISYTSTYCALCKLFIKSCRECPINEYYNYHSNNYSSYAGCELTPWHKVFSIIDPLEIREFDGSVVYPTLSLISAISGFLDYLYKVRYWYISSKENSL